MKTFVIGHKNPDMDSICSALAYAEFKQTSGEESTVLAARCGSTNERIDYVLQRFGFDPPIFLSDVSPCVEDVMETAVITAQAEEPIFHALARMRENHMRSLPVVEGATGRCIGLLSTYKLTNYLLLKEQASSPYTLCASLADIRESLAASVATMTTGSTTPSFPSSQPQIYSLLVAAVAEDAFSSLLRTTSPSTTIVIIGDHPQILEKAAEAGVAAIILTQGAQSSEKALELCREKGTAIFLTTGDTSNVLIQIRSAIRVNQMLDEEFQSIPPDLPLEEARRTLVLSSQYTFPVLSQDGVLLGVFSKSDFLKPVPRQLILVDHNELSQAVAGVQEVPIIEILDHHRLGGAIHTETPILFINRPVGSTSTIVAGIYESARQPIPKNVAGILMAGLIADTLNLTSPTTTAVDRQVLADLAEITAINPSHLAEEIFSVVSPLQTLTPQQAITTDCKEYRERGYTFTISQIEELSFSHFPEKRQSLIQVLEEYRSQQGHLFSALLVTDINSQNSLLLVRGNKDYLQKIDYPAESPFIWQLQGIVSRKKQLLPYLSSLLTKKGGFYSQNFIK